MDRYNEHGITGKILHVDSPATFPEMTTFVGKNAHVIEREIERCHFMMLKFLRTELEGSAMDDDESIWIEIKNRNQIGGANEWHTHPGVIIFSPQQSEAAVATGITVHENIHDTRRKLGLSIQDTSYANPAGLIALNDKLPAFWTSDISESGHVLILPENTIHARETLPPTTTKTAGILHRKWLKDIRQIPQVLSR